MMSKARKDRSGRGRQRGVKREEGEREESKDKRGHI